MKKSLLPILAGILALTIALQNYSATPVVKILDPRYSNPIACFPGELFNITIAGMYEVDKAWLIAPGLNYTLNIVQIYPREGGYKILTKVPENVKPELYDIYLISGAGLIREPRCVWIIDRYPDNITFIHLTDIHIGVITDNIPSHYYYQTAINLVNALPVDFAVITGDDIDKGNDIIALKTFYKVTNKARKPTFIIPGNHDHYHTDVNSFKEKYYGFYVGPAYWYRVIGSFLIVGLDTGAMGFMNSSQLKWFKNILAKYNDKVKIVLMHHPIFNSLFGEVKGSWTAQVPSAAEFLRLVEQYEVKLVLSGHVHKDGVVLYNGRTWFVTTTTTSGPKVSQYHGFRIITVTSDGKVIIQAPKGKDPLHEAASFNIEKISMRYVTNRDNTACTIVVDIEKDFELNLSNVILHFYVSSQVEKYEYGIYGEVESFEIKRYGPDWYVATVKTDLKPGVKKIFTVASFKDEKAPSVKIDSYSPKNPVLGKDLVTFYISASDDGWGVDQVYLVYETPNGTSTVLSTYLWRGMYYIAEIPPLNFESIEVWAKAVDFAGDWKESEKITISYKQLEEEKTVEKQEQMPSSEVQEEKGIFGFPLQLAVMIIVIIVIVIAFVLIKHK